MNELLNQYRFLRSCGNNFSGAIEMLSRHYKVSEEVITKELERQEETVTVKGELYVFSA